MLDVLSVAGLTVCPLCVLGMGVVERFQELFYRSGARDLTTATIEHVEGDALHAEPVASSWIALTLDTLFLPAR